MKTRKYIIKNVQAKNELERSEQILKETSTEKQQLLKSVNTFEQENRDLKKVCKQLHTQIDIYQKDTDSKYAKVLEQKRTREQDEIKRLKMEMNQVSVGFRKHWMFLLLIFSIRSLKV